MKNSDHEKKIGWGESGENRSRMTWHTEGGLGDGARDVQPEDSTDADAIGERSEYPEYTMPIEPEQGSEIPESGLPEKTSVCSEVYEWAESFMSVLLPMIIIMVFLLRPATVFGQSMEPTLHNSDRLFLQVAGYNDPQYGDIVVVDRSWNGGEAVVKRVIGKAGDVMFIDFEKHEVWRNDEMLDEPYINEPTAEWGDVAFPVQIPEGTVFVMGDNRNHSMDSRTTEIGMVDTRRVMGKVALRFFPLDKIGAVT